MKYLCLHYRKCEELYSGQCFTEAEQAAEFLVANLKAGWNPGVPVQSISSASTGIPPTTGPGMCLSAMLKIS